VERDKIMAKIKTIKDINTRYIDSEGKTKIAIIDSGSFIEVSEEMATYWCNEDIELLSPDERKKNTRLKKAIRTENDDDKLKPHMDYTSIK
jgi:hypothetical protein